jgi:two-component system C4-dicarboxylate transport response regulator DctD
MRALRETLLRIAPMPANVIVLGETGTGKELVARCLHEFSGRSGRFIAINCAAVPENLFEGELFGHEPGAYTGATKQRIGEIESANGGTLLLDEIETMPLHLQVKLLRVLQEREVKRLGSSRAIPIDVRVVAATKDDLKALSQEGRFRADLFYRLNVATLRLPALRERREDIPMLVAHFLREAVLRFGTGTLELPPGLHQQLLAHDWPGNVRELRNAAEQSQLGVPLSIGGEGRPARLSLDDAMAAFERTVIETALQRCGGNANAACEELQVNYATLHRRMKRYDIDLQRFRRKPEAD